jgi:hypothetical protein
MLSPANVCSDCSYFFEFDYVKEQSAFKLDKNNVTYIDYSKVKSLGVNNTLSYNPISIGLSGLRFLQNGKNKLFFAQANWLVENIDSIGAWYIQHDKKASNYTLKGPWSSALAQGFGISVLVRAYRLSGDEQYIVAARKALIPFQKDIQEGGIAATTEFGIFYEEYPFKDNPTHVLNGFMYSLFALYDLYQIDNNEIAKKLFDEGIATLTVILPQYDLDHWSRYDLNEKIGIREHWGYASPWYQKLHFVQLDALYRLTGEKIFKTYADKFQTQAESSWVNAIIYPAYVSYITLIKIVRTIG